MDFWELMLAQKLGGGGIDTSADTVTADTILEGYTAHNAAGEQIVGSIPTYEGEAEEYSEWIGDGNTHIWIELSEERKSPMLGLAVSGTATVDWGDGTEPDVLRGTSAAITIYTPNHEYAKAGNYIVTLTINGEASFVGKQTWGYASCVLVHMNGADIRNREYARAIKKIEVGSATSIGNSAFSYCTNLRSITIPDSITSIGNNAFSNCSNLQSITIPDNVTSIGSYAFSYCTNLQSITIPDSITSLGLSAFSTCSSLQSITIPDNVTSIGSGVFASCTNLRSITIPDNVTSIGSSAFSGCTNLQSITIPDSITSIGNNAFSTCSSLQSITIPDSITSIGSSAFSYNGSMVFYDFSECTDIPALGNTNAFASIPSNCEIRVPAALAEEWKAATNWSTYADKIVGV